MEGTVQTTGMGTGSKVEKALSQWLANLIDLTRRNKLIYFAGAPGTSLRLLNPEQNDLFSYIYSQGKSFKVHGNEVATTDQPKKVSSIVFAMEDADVLKKSLKNIYRKARTEMEERGLQVLFITFGMLKWYDPTFKTQARSPIFLLPVTLSYQGPLEPFVLSGAEDDPFLNPALVAKFEKDFRIKLPPPPEEVDEASMAAYFKQVQQAAASVQGAMESESWLAVFSFAKLAIYEDLKANSPLVKSHGIVRAICRDGLLDKTEIPDVDRIDRTLDPVDDYTITDLDGSQRVAVEASKLGTNLVVHGPPGTGKSQTITNIISEFIARGKSVLFVSEKMAALQVVYQRLKNARLDQFCLELHSNKANKKYVIDQIYRAYTNRLEAGDIMTDAELAILKQKQQKLQAYADTLHRKIEPTGKSLFELLCRLNELRQFPLVKIEGADPKLLDPLNLEKLKDAARNLSRFNKIFEEGRDFPWYGLRGGEEMSAAVKSTIQKRAALEKLDAQLASRLGITAPADSAQSDWLLALAKVLENVIPPAENWFAEAGLDQFWGAENNYKNTAARYRAVMGLPAAGQAKPERVEFLKAYTPKIFQLDLDNLAIDFRTKYAGFFRFFKLSYYDARNKIAACRKDMRSPQNALAELELAIQLKKSFDWTARFLDVYKDSRPSEQTLKFLRASETFEPVSDALSVALSDFKSEFAKLSAQFEGNTSVSATAPYSLAWASLAKMASRPQDIALWKQLCETRTTLSKIGLHVFIDALIQNRKAISAGDLGQALERALVASVVDRALKTEESLKGFTREEFERIVKEYSDLDAKFCRKSFGRVVSKASARIPATTAVIPGSEAQILMHEAMKQRRHMPLRKLFGVIPGLLRKIKPCFLMSPLSISQFVEPGKLDFDVVIFDEASQVRTEDAICAIYRGKQVIICGDNKQLPPTSFFERAVAEGDTSEDQASEDEESLESILDECIGAGIPQLWLRFHYRSKHDSLIAFSNDVFYDDRLFVFPAAIRKTPELGIELVHLPEAVYDRGGKRNNVKEAERVVQLVIEHFKTRPDDSIGVIAFSIQQSDTIEELMDQARAKDPSLEQFFQKSGTESFFVKNLENVQGDERDVIIFSIGYGRDQTGKLTMNFGPLNLQGGERRLNVAVTRARKKVIVVSSLKSHDFNLNDIKAEGVKQLACYLSYAEGTSAAKALADSEGDVRSTLESDIKGVLEREGYRLVEGVGAGKFRVDLAIVDEVNPDKMLLGIEVDGRGYRTTPTVRDRERLWFDMLKANGWLVYRIRAIDWALNREDEIKRLMAAVENAKNRPAGEQTLKVEHSGPQISEVERNVVDAKQNSASAIPAWASVYKVLRVPNFKGAPALDSPNAPQIVLKIIAAVLEAELPIHFEVLLARVSRVAKYDRVSKRLRDIVSEALGSLTRQGTITVRGEFIYNRTGKISVRVPNPKDDESYREIEEIPPEEIELAVRSAVKDACSIEREALASYIALLFGFSRATENIRAPIDTVVDRLVSTGAIKSEDGRLTT